MQYMKLEQTCVCRAVRHTHDNELGLFQYSGPGAGIAPLVYAVKTSSVICVEARRVNLCVRIVETGSAANSPMRTGLPLSKRQRQMEHLRRCLL
jgi:hypothetical protein